MNEPLFKEQKAMSTGQVWLTNTLGGTMWSPALFKVLRVVVSPLV